jgi:hypothetical protein
MSSLKRKVEQLEKQTEISGNCPHHVLAILFPEDIAADDDPIRLCERCGRPADILEVCYGDPEGDAASPAANVS